MHWYNASSAESGSFSSIGVAAAVVVVLVDMPSSLHQQLQFQQHSLLEHTIRQHP
jgi:hypothetical protein